MNEPTRQELIPNCVCGHPRNFHNHRTDPPRTPTSCGVHDLNGRCQCKKWREATS